MEVFKSLILLPYAGFLTNAGPLGKTTSISCAAGTCRFAYGHNTLSVGRNPQSLPARLQRPAGCPTPHGTSPAVSRLVPKKNLGSFSSMPMPSIRIPLFRHGHFTSAVPANSRPTASKNRRAWPSKNLVILQPASSKRPEIAQELAQSLALILPSIEEQFGNVIIEAQAMGVPTLISYNCGALETLVRSGVNGFVVEPDNPAGLAFFMQWLQEDTDLWERLALGCCPILPRADTPAFVEGVMKLL